MLCHVEPLLQEAVSWICTCPPFCYQDNTDALQCLSQAVDREQFDQDCHDNSEHLPYYFLSFSRDVLEILVAIYNFCILIRAFEQKYLRNLKKRNESTFAKAAHEQETEDELLTAIQKKLSVSAQVAKRLLEEYHTFFLTESLGDRVFDVSYGGDPAKAYDRFMRRTLLFQRMEEVLKPRELNLVRSYLGLDQPDGRGMTFQELAIRLNYNGPSGAEKAYKSAIRKLKRQLNGGAYGQWIAIQKAIREAVREVSQKPGYHSPQSVWWEQRHMAQ